MTRLLRCLAVAIALTGCAVQHAASGTPASASAGLSSAVGGSLRLIVEPQAGGDRPFVKLIASAKHTVELTMYELDDPAIDRALAAARRRGVRVRVLLNGGYYHEHESTNEAADRQLRADRIAVRWTPGYFALTHQKTLVIDRRVAVIMTLNFTARYYATTRDFAVEDRQPGDVRAIVGVFDADWQRRKITPSDGTGDLVWSPGATARTLTLIGQARRSLRIENEEMDDPAVTRALCAAARRHVTVQITMTYESDWKQALTQLARCGVSVGVDHGEQHPIYIHAKAIVADDHTAMVGSQNFSPTSLDANRELGIITTDRGIVGPLSRQLQRDHHTAAGTWTP